MSFLPCFSLPGEGGSISYCLCYRGRMALLFFVSGHPRHHALGQKWMVTAMETQFQIPLPTVCLSPGASLTPGYFLKADGTQAASARIQSPRKTPALSRKPSQSWRAKQSLILFEVLKMMSFPCGYQMRQVPCTFYFVLLILARNKSVFTSLECNLLEGKAVYMLCSLLNRSA